MPDSAQTAVRVGDDILHSEAHHWGVLGIVTGVLVGAVIGVALVGGTIATGGALAFVVGAALVGGGVGGILGKIHGSHKMHARGKVLTGSPNVFIGHDKKPAARAEADVAHCEDHSDSEPAQNQPAILGKKIAQGSEHVLINGHYAARHGDKGTCDFTLGDGWPTVVIGGPPKTVAGLTITSETASIDGLITGMLIVGSILMMVPAAALMLSAGAEAGVTGLLLYGQVGARLVAQYALGGLMSYGGGIGAHYVGANLLGLKEGDERLEMLTFGGQVLTPFAGARGYKAIGDAPFFGGRPVEAVPGAIPVGESVPQRYGGTGAEPEFTSTQAEQARANAAYDQIRANDDVAQIARNTGHSPEQIQAVKDHLFNSQHDIFDPQTGQSSPGNFTPDEGIANLWNKAGDGTLGQPRMTKWGTPIEGTGDPAEVTNFNRLIAHEYVEQGLVSDGLPYQHPDSWVQDANGEWQYRPGPNNFGAHDLSPNFRDEPFSHYETTLGRSSEGIPRPNETNSNLDDVLAGIRRSLGRDGGPEGPGGGGPAGPEGGPNTGGPSGRGPPSAGEDPFVPARPLPPYQPEGRPITPAPDAAPPAAPDAAPGGRPGTGTAAEPTTPLAETSPEAARATPEPAPAADAPTPAGSVPANPRYTGGPASIPRTNPNGGHLPADFDLTSIADNPQQAQAFQQALQRAATSRQAYRDYLAVLDRGETPSQSVCEKAWNAVRQEYKKAFEAIPGNDLSGVEVHHWNYNKKDFPNQVFDPRNLYHTVDRSTSWNSHEAVHRATVSTGNIWQNPADPIHLIPLDNVYPLSPPPPPIQAP